MPASLMRTGAFFLLLGAGMARADTFLIKSTDGGRSWTDIDPGPPHARLLALHRAGASSLYALTQTWTEGQRVPAARQGTTTGG